MSSDLLPAIKAHKFRRPFLIVPLLLLPLFAYLAYRDLVRLNEATADVEHTYQVMMATDGLLSLLKDVETGQRGYLLTGKTEFLQPYESALRALPGVELHIHALIADNSSQRALFDRIFALAKLSLEDSRRMVNQFQAGNADRAFEMFETGPGKKTMDEIRKLVTQANRTEQALLERRSTEAGHQADFTRLLVGFGGSVLMIVFTGVAIALEWDHRGRQRAALALAQEQERLRVALLHVPLTLYTASKNLRYSWVYRTGPSTQRGELELLPFDTDPGIAAFKEEVLRTGMGGMREARVVQNGRPAVYNVTVEPLRNAAGRLTGITVAALDISIRAAAQEALRKSEEQFRQLIDSMPQLVWSARPDGMPDHYNRQWSEYTGAVPPAARRDSWISLLHPEDRERVHERWRQSLHSGEPFEIELRCRRHDGQYRWFLGRATAIRGANGAIERWFGTCTEIHGQKQLESDLRIANQDLESFAYAAAHDLQEPVRMITIYSQMLERKLRESSDPAVQELLMNVIGGAKRMAALLRDLLSYAELSRSDEDVQVKVSLAAAVEAAKENLAAAIADSGAQITTDSLPAAHGYASHYELLFQNLLGNAMKYRGSQPPEIHISAKPAGLQWIVRVSDNGLGIAKEHQREIFGVFKRLHGKNIPGTGIGLAICQRVVERHGGAIWVESKGEGHGSAFCFSIPITEEKHFHET